MIELSPETKSEFEQLCMQLKIDKQTKLRTIYLFDEFLKKRNLKGEETSPKLYPIFLKIAMFVGSKNMTLKSIDGKDIRDPGFRLTSFFSPTQNQFFKKYRNNCSLFSRIRRTIVFRSRNKIKSTKHNIRVFIL